LIGWLSNIVLEVSGGNLVVIGPSVERWKVCEGIFSKSDFEGTLYGSV
jgi:hypothetical protein